MQTAALKVGRYGEEAQKILLFGLTKKSHAFNWLQTAGYLQARPGGGTGRHACLRGMWEFSCTGSSPVSGTAGRSFSLGFWFLFALRPDILFHLVSGGCVGF